MAGLTSSVSSHTTEKGERIIVGADEVENHDEYSVESGSNPDIVLNPDRTLHLKFIDIPQYYNPYTQVVIAGITNLLSVGMFNVLVSLGGSGQVDATTSDNANTILYAFFAFVALFSGSLVNYFGPRLMLSLGAIGYAVYGSAFWCYNNTQNKGYVYFSGVCCGVGAGVLWTACGTIMASYPTEKQKGRFVSIFFFLSFLGSVIGGIIPAVQNYNNTSSGSVSNGTYAAVTILMILAGATGLLAANPDKMIRTDGTRVLAEKHKSFPQEIKAIHIAIKQEPWFVFFLPFAFMALYYPAYQSNDFNGYYFNVRTRSINGLLYGISQMVGAVLFGIYLDVPFMKRRARAISGWAILFVTVFIISLCGYFPARDSHRSIPLEHPMDMTDGAKAAKYMTLYFFYGWQDGMLQAFAFFVMGALSNDPNVISMYTGFYKVLGAVAAAIAFGTDAGKIPFLSMFASYWAVCLTGMICIGILIIKRVKDTLEPETYGS